MKNSKKIRKASIRRDIPAGNSDASLFSYDELFSHTRLGIYRNTPGPKGHFLQANMSLVRMFEAKSKKDFLRHNVSDLYQDPSQRAIFSKKILKNGFVDGEELPLKTLKGKKIICEVTAVLKKDNNGEIYFDGMIENITERKKALNFLFEGREKLQKLFDILPVGISILNSDGRISDMNSALEKILGISKAGLLAGNYSKRKYLRSDGTLMSAEEFPSHRARKENRIIRDVEIGVVKEDGKIVWTSVSAAPLQSEDRSLVVVTVDITERKQAEHRIRRLINLYKALSECNQAIMRSDNEEELFGKICRDMVSFGGMRMAWIGFTDPKTGMIKSAASDGIGTEYLKGIHISTDKKSKFGRGPTGTAVREKRPFWCQDFQHDPVTLPWRKGGLKFGWKSSASLPIYRGGSVVGALTLYTAEANAFDEEAKQLLIEVSSDLGYALDNFDSNSARQLAEKNLRESKDMYRKLIETEPECVKLMSKDNILLDMNSAGLAMIEADSLNQVAGKSVIDLIDSEHRETFKDVTRKVFRGKEASTQFRITGLKGGKRWLETHAVPLLNEKGEIYSLLSVTRDITESKKSEAALQESEYFFRESQRVGSIGSYKLDFKIGRWESSAVLDRIFGIGKNYDRSISGWLDIVYPDDREMMNRYLTEEVIGKQTNFNKKYRIVRMSDGETRWMSGLGQVKFDSDGKPLSMIGTIQDVTEPKKNEEAIRNRVSELEKLKNTLTDLLNELGAKEKEVELEKVRYEVLLGNIIDGVIAIDTDKKITYVNEEAGKLVGINADNLIGKKYFEMWNLRSFDGDVLLPQEERPFSLALKGEHDKINKRYILERKDGRKIPVSISIGPIVASGKIIGANVVIRDITEQAEVDRAKNEFISVASHQLRTPLSSMKWLIEALLTDKNIAANSRAKIENLFASNERLIVLVNDLLSISRMESGKFLGEIQQFDLTEIIRRALTDSEPAAAKAGKKLSLSLPEKIKKVRANPVLFFEAFKNILSNAIDYSDDNSVISVKVKVADGAYLIAINNSGQLISAEDHDKLFTKFFRAPSAKLIKPGGSGLGLYISKMGIEKNGGTVWFESDRKNGTTFYFTIPTSKD